MAPATDEGRSQQAMANVVKKTTIVDEWSPPPACVTAAGGIPRHGDGLNRRSTRTRSRASRQRSNLLRSMEMNNDDEDNDGEPLTTELVAAGLDRIALVGYQAALNFTRLMLPRCNIRDISVLTQFAYLQELDLSFNKIEDLTPLREMRYLTALNFENNHIRQIHFLTLSPSLTSFRRLNFADNSIAKLPQFAGYLSLLSLNMHGNELVNLDGLASTRYLRYVDVSDNHIKSLDELCSAEHLAYLDVSGNRVKKLGLTVKSMKQLKTLKIAHNRLNDLAGLEELTNLHVLDAGYNRIQQLEALLHLQNVRFLSNLDLSGNPVCRREAFVPMVYYLCNNLARLNGKPCTDADWLQAKEMFLVNPLIRGVRDHFRDVAMKIASFQFNGTQQHLLQQTASTSAGDTPATNVEQKHQTFTMIFLMGPPGGGRETLAYRLSTQCPHLVRLVRTVTTRIESVAALPEILMPRNDYVYEPISESAFRSLVRNNQLLLSYGRRGCLYGIRESDIDDAARQNLAVVACIDTTGVTDLIGSNVRPTTFYIYPFTPSIMRARVEECGYDDVNTKRVLSSLHYSETLREKFPDFFHGKIDSDDVDKAYETLLNKLEEVSGLRISDPPGGWKWSCNSQLAAAVADAAASLDNNEPDDGKLPSLSNAQQQQPSSSLEKNNTEDDRKRLGKHTMASIINMPQTRSDFLFLDEDLKKTQDLSLLLPAMLPHHLRNSFSFGESSEESEQNTTRVNFTNADASQHQDTDHERSGSGQSSSDERFGEVYFKSTKMNGDESAAEKLKSAQLLAEPAEFEASWERRMEKSMMDEIQHSDGMFDVDFADEMQKFAEPGAARWLADRQTSTKAKSSSRKRSGTVAGGDAGTNAAGQNADLFQPLQQPVISLPTVTTDDMPHTHPIDMTTAITAQPDLIFDSTTADSSLFAEQRRRSTKTSPIPQKPTKSKNSLLHDKHEIVPIGRDIPIPMLPRLGQRQLFRIDVEIRKAVQRDVGARRESPTYETAALQQLPALRLQQPVMQDDSDDEERQQQQVRQKMMSKMRLYNVASQQQADEDFYACPIHPGCNVPHHTAQNDPSKTTTGDDAYRKFDTYRQRITSWRRAVSASRREQKRVRDQQRQKQVEDSVKPSPVALAAMMGGLRGKNKLNNADEDLRPNNVELAYLDGIEIAGALPRKQQDVFSLERQQQFLARQTDFPPVACRDLACVHPGRKPASSSNPLQQSLLLKKLKQQRFESDENVNAHNNVAS